MGATDHAPMVEGAALILEYGDYESPYSRQAFRSIERVEQEPSAQVRFAFRHFPLTRIHPHALAASAAAAARQGRSTRRCWRIERDVESGEATGVVRGTPTLFIDGILYEGGYDPAAIIEAVRR